MMNWQDENGKYEVSIVLSRVMEDGLSQETNARVCSQADRAKATRVVDLLREVASAPTLEHAEYAFVVLRRQLLPKEVVQQGIPFIKPGDVAHVATPSAVRNELLVALRHHHDLAGESEAPLEKYGFYHTPVDGWVLLVVIGDSFYKLSERQAAWLGYGSKKGARAE